MSRPDDRAGTAAGARSEEVGGAGSSGGGPRPLRPAAPDFDVRLDGGSMTLHGEFDVAGVALFRTRTAGTVGDVLVDLAGLRFVDASGLGALIGFATALWADGHRLTVRNPARNVRRAFTTAGLDHLLSA